MGNDTPCVDNGKNNVCYPRTDPTYNVPSGQCRAGTTDCCCTDGCCCPQDLPCQQLNDAKCMPMVNPLGAYCKYPFDKDCTCSAGTKQCSAGGRTCPVRPTPPPTPAATPAPTPCNKAIDLFFLVDDSHSIGQENWPSVQQGMAAIVGNLQINPQNVQLAAETFDYKDHFVGFDFLNYTDTASAAKAINQLSGISTTLGTYTCAAISEGHQQLMQGNGARANAKKVMVVFTDGKPTGGPKKKKDACKGKNALANVLKAARDAGILMMSVGIGGTYDMNSLQTMATKPYSKNVFGIKGYNPGIVAQQIIDSACE
jgi:hypothetical protein